MRDFTPEEKELIVNTEITRDCFEGTETAPAPFFAFVSFLDFFREEVSKCEGMARKNGFSDLVSMLPNSYNVVKI